MELAKIEINDFRGSPVCEHNMPCAVCGVRKAVYMMNSGYFNPCRSCEELGWKTVNLKKFPWWLKWAVPFIKEWQ